MSTLSRSVPGSARSVVDAAIELVTQARYRQAHLQLVYHARSTPLVEAATLVNEATRVTGLPVEITAEYVVAWGKPGLLPHWLEPAVDTEIRRILDRIPVGADTPDRLVARIIAAISIDAAADRMAVDRPGLVAHHDDLGPEMGSHERMIDLRSPGLAGRAPRAASEHGSDRAG